jgi:fatty-acyl-CoA synthase
VIGIPDAHRGETVKALVVVRPEWRERLTEQAVIDWCRENMATYKVPRVVAFVESLPKSGSGKIQWRELQEREKAAVSQRGDTTSCI